MKLDERRRASCDGVVKVALSLVVGFAVYCAAQSLLVAGAPALDQPGYGAYLTARSVTDTLFEVYSLVIMVLFMHASWIVVKNYDLVELLRAATIVVASGVGAYLFALLLETLSVPTAGAFVAVAFDLVVPFSAVLLFQVLSGFAVTRSRRRSRAEV